MPITNITPPIVELRGVTHIYNIGSVYEKTAISQVNLIFNPGEMIGLIGHTGSGKSTLIQHLNALLKPTSGTVLIDGEDINSDKRHKVDIRKRVGLVFQYPEHQLFETSVFKDVAYGPTRMGLSGSEIDEHTKKALSIVGLGEDIYEKSPFELSGGQKRRVAIAGVLAMRPQVLVLDEPTAGLDPQGRNEILSRISHMHQELGITVILVSHSMDDAARLSERIIVMNKGEVLCDAPPADVFCHGELLTSIGLDTPQISQLMTGLNAINSTVPTGIFTVKDAAAALLALHKKQGGAS